LDVAPLLDHQRLVCTVVGIGERHGLLALGCDRGRGGDHVELALSEISKDRVERGVLDLHGEAKLFADFIDEIDV
jgi:hypothetical protein